MKYRYFSTPIIRKSGVLFSLLFTLIVVLMATNAKAQNAPSAASGRISGRVLDKKTGESVIGVNVLIEGTGIGTATDIDGRYNLKVAPGTYTIVFSFISYQNSKFEGVVVAPGQTVALSVNLEESSTTLSEVVIVKTIAKESMDALINERRNAAQASDGISAELIRRTPDRNSGDVLRRVSGTSIQEGKFPVIRGLNDRYNNAFLNGAPLPSSETDRKAFAFDIFPASMLESIVVIKTATPDIPAEFAGGAVQIKTRDIPEENFISLSLGTTLNTLTTFGEFKQAQSSRTDILGLDDGLRKMPAGLPNFSAWQAQDNASMYEVIAQNSSKFNNNWAVSTTPAASGMRWGIRPGTSLQLAAGRNFDLGKERRFGSIMALSYANTVKRVIMDRNIYGATPEYIGMDNRFNNDVLAGLIWNNTYQFNKNNKISLKSLYNINTQNQTTLRNATDIINGQILQNYLFTFTQNRMFSSQLGGEHFLPSTKIKLSWLGGYSAINRLMPDFRVLTYQKPADEPERAFAIPLSNQAQAGIAQRFYSDLNENIKNFKYDISIPFETGVGRLDAKFGGYHQGRSRSFDSRLFGYGYGPNSDFMFINRAATMGVDTIFRPSNIGADRLFLKDASKKSNNYTAGSTLHAGYAMLDGKLFGFLRTTGGLRVESYNQRLKSFDESDKAVNLDTTVVDLLPSMSVVADVSKRLSLRGAYSKTLSRPEFRELAPFAFLDFNDNLLVSGSPTLQRAYIHNFDLRAEYFPGAGQLISVSVFAKTFNKPIERVMRDDVSQPRILYVNAQQARNRGIELDVRQSLGMLSSNPNSWLYNLTVSGNLTLTASEVTLGSAVLGAGDNQRPLQGQSSYIVNGGISYFDQEHGRGITLSYNKVGPRIAYVGTTTQPNIWEKPRDVIDLQISHAFFKNKLEVRLNANDILAQRLLLVEDSNNNKKVDKDDLPAFSYYYGSNFSAIVVYRF